MEVLELVLPYTKDFWPYMVVVFLILWIIYQYVKNNKNIFHKAKVSSKYHMIFPMLKSYIITEVDSLSLSSENKLKNELFKRMLKIKFKRWLKLLQEIVKEKKKEIWFKYLVNESKAIKWYTKEWEEHPLIPQMAIDKFNSWHVWKVRELARWIKELIETSAYDDNPDLLEIAILNIHQRLFDQTIIDLQVSIESMNGELEEELVILHNQNQNENIS